MDFAYFNRSGAAVQTMAQVAFGLRKDEADGDRGAHRYVNWHSRVWVGRHSAPQSREVIMSGLTNGFDGWGMDGAQLQSCVDGIKLLYYA